MPVDKERKLHNFLRDHPYVVDVELDGCKPKSEVWIGNKRLDLLFYSDGQYTVMEIKRTRLEPRDIDQLAEYVEELRRRGYRLTEQHYLVGKKPRDESEMLSYASRKSFLTIFRVLGKDVQLEFMWDRETRRYVPFIEDLQESETRYTGYYDFRF